jgi:hypothetical protein
VARRDTGADAGLALEDALKHQFADAGTDSAAADTQSRGQLDLIRQKCPSLVFGQPNQLPQELLDLGAERDGTLMIQLQHALMYKQMDELVSNGLPWAFQLAIFEGDC